jgi:hypothetical protein
MATDDERAEIEKRLARGDWLPPRDVAVLFDVTRFAVDYWLRNGRTRYGPLHFRKTAGGHRLCDPADVRHMVEEYRKVHGGGTKEDPPTQE